MKFLSKKLRKNSIPIIFFVFWFVFFLFLSLFRNASLDENIYLGESAVIADLLRQGKWIGNYGVGLHGFITKLFVGIIFLITGPSVFVATVFNVILGLICGVVFFKILKDNFRQNNLWSLAGVTLLFSSFQFLTYIPTFYRDVGVLLAVLILIKLILDGKNKWIIGIALLFVLDFKEYVFFMLAPAIIIWEIVVNWRLLKTSFWSFLKSVIFENFEIFLPSVIFITLMLFTSIIPLNIYTAKVLGLTEEGLKSVTMNFDPNVATYNRDVETNPGVAKVIPQISDIRETRTGLLNFFVEAGNVILLYIGKIAYPRTFSFLSIPFVMLIPSLYYSISRVKAWYKRNEYLNLFLVIVLLVYLLIYVMHSSIGRYLLPISPVVYLFFIMFLNDNDLKKKERVNALVLTIIFVVLGLLFEYSYLPIKIGINLLLLILIYFVLFREVKTPNLKFLLVFVVSTFSMGTALLASYQNGQIASYIAYGYNRECEKILGMVEENDKIWINDIGWDRLPFVLRSENVQDPEWKWGLKEWVPKKDLLCVEEKFRTSSTRWRTEKDFLSIIEKGGVTKVVYIQINKDFKYDNLLMQDRIGQLSSFTWLKLVDTVELKNKTVYIFDVSF